MATVAKGARRPNSPFRGKLDLFFLADLSWRSSRRSQLHNLAEVKVLEVPSALRQDWTRLQQAAYAAALVEELTETDTPIPELFELLNQFVRHLNTRGATPARMLAFEAQCLYQQGLDPSQPAQGLNPASHKILHELLHEDPALLDDVSLPLQQAEQLTRHLYTCLLAHLQRIPKSRRAVYRLLLQDPS